MKDSIINLFLNLYISIARRINKKPKQFPPKSRLFVIKEHHTFKQDDFTSKKWYKGLWWGTHSEDEEYSFRDNDNISTRLGPDFPLSLHTSKVMEPRVNPNTGLRMPFSEAAIMKANPITDYGAVEVVVDIYPGSAMWHAPLWFITAAYPGTDKLYNVLPELDVCELYSEEKPFAIKAKSDVHYGEDYDENSKRKGAITHYIPNIFSRTVSFGLVWTRDYVRFYYDGWLVRQITDKSILERLKPGIIPIINTSVYRKYAKYHTNSLLEVISYRSWRLVK